MKKIFVLFLLLILISLFLHTCMASASEGCKVTGKISFGYDDNIYEQSESKIGRPYCNVYLDSQFPLTRFKHLEGAFRLQNGLKIIRKEENSALNQIDLKLALFIFPTITAEILNELKHKTVTISSDSPVQNEYGYLYWHSGVSLRFHGKNFNSSLIYLQRQHDYENVDFSDSKTQQIQLLTSIPLSSKLTGCLTEKIEIIDYSGEEQPDREGRVDHLYELSIGCQWLDGILINPGYAFQMNISKHFEYSYKAHQWTLITALPLWWEVTLQFYGRLQFRTYDEHPPQSIIYPLDEDNQDQLRKLLVFSISKDVSKNCTVEARYLLSESDLSISSLHYTKHTYSFGVSYSF